LNAEQQRAVDLSLAGTSFFLTGEAGTGKSWSLETIIEQLKANGTEVAVTAATGLAASQIGGSTLHAFAGIGLGNDPIERLVASAKQERLRTRWSGVDTLIIDEVSMVDPVYWSKLQRVAQVARNNPREPFGGLQVIAVGDFFQLPPVAKPDHAQQARYCFETKAWQDTFHHVVNLTQVFRQKDGRFVALLNRARRGRLTPDDVALLRNRLNVSFTAADGIEPTLLYPYNKKVQEENQAALKKLPSKPRLYRMKTGSTSVANGTTRLDLPDADRKKPMTPVEREALKLRNNCPASQELLLKVGAQVMLLANLRPEAGLVNGSRGVVVGFDRHHYPVVRFAKCRATIQAFMWKTRLGDYGHVWASQIPLKLAYAYTIHKAQGQSMDRVKLRLVKTFEAGQGYVALSRVRTLEGLCLTGFNPEAIQVDPKVIAFYDALEN